jgi:2,5-diketo-D-gluconate reductase A
MKLGRAGRENGYLQPSESHRRRRESVVTAVPEILLNNGRSIPQFGFGVFQVEPRDTVAAVSTALKTGYRHIDTAEMYGNEKEVGEAIAKSGLDRGDVFVTSKLSNDAHLPDDARAAFDLSLEELGFDYLDLFLIHWPLPTRYDGDFVSTWRTLEEFYRDGRARSIGVSNFQPHHIRRLHTEAEIPPAINQIEVHPYLTQDDVRGFCAQHQIAIEGWSPLGQGRELDDPTIREIAERIGKTPAQVVLRWHIERGDIVFPKSVTPARIKENFALFDFELSGEDVEAISALDKNERSGPDPDTFTGS